MAQSVGRFLENCAGVNLALPAESIRDNELADARNVVPSPTGIGSPKKRRGINKYSPSASSDRTFIGSIYAGLFGPYYTDQSASEWDIRSVDGSSLYSGTGTTEFPCWRTFLTYDAVVDGTNYLKTSDGTNFTAIANIPSGVKFIESYNRHFFAAGHDNFTVRHADISTLETWTSSNARVIDEDQADHITGLKNAGIVLVIFFGKSFHHLQGFSFLDFSVTYSNHSIGCLANRSILATPYGGFWWSDRGFVWSPDWMGIDLVGMRKLSSDFIIPVGRCSDIHGVWDTVNECAHMYIPYPTGTQCNTRIDYYPKTDSIYIQDGLGCEMACSAYVTIPLSGE